MLKMMTLEAGEIVKKGDAVYITFDGKVTKCPDFKPKYLEWRDGKIHLVGYDEEMDNDV